MKIRLRKLTIGICGAFMTIATTGHSAKADVTLKSPDGKVTAKITTGEAGQLHYNLFRDGKTVLENSPLGITVDGENLGTSVRQLEAGETAEVNQTYPCRGVKATASNHYKQTRVKVTRRDTGDNNFEMIWRLYDDGAAYRYVIPGDGQRTINGETSSWNLPAGTEIWSQTSLTNYEHVYKPYDLPLKEVITMPATCVLPGGDRRAEGYALLMEAALYNYSGMVLESGGENTVQAKFHWDKSWTVPADSVTPWRVTVTSPTLNGLVNSTMITNLNEPPAPPLADADWIRPGKTMWSWWAHKTRLQDQIPYMDAAVKLNCDYVLWDEGWRDWSEDELNHILEYARDKNVGVWLWDRWNSLATAEQREKHFSWIKKKNEQLGRRVIVGVKLDFMDSESKERIQWYQAALEDAAKYELMVNFHGSNKPTGYSRRYPNEMTREGIRGLEYHIWGDELPPSHNAALPFTRLLAGHADYTPTTYWDERLGRTTYAQQLAMAFVLTSPVMHWADDPSRYYESPARDVMEAMPVCWDETVVLSQSQIGELAAFARRKGDTWFLAVVNGDAEKDRSLDMNLSFLPEGKNFDALLLADNREKQAAFNRSERIVSAEMKLPVWLRQGGGFVAMFKPAR
jgi:alpha-glucosidase